MEFTVTRKMTHRWIVEADSAAEAASLAEDIGKAGSDGSWDEARFLVVKPGPTPRPVFVTTEQIDRFDAAGSGN